MTTLVDRTIGALKRGGTAAWVAVSTAVYLAALLVITQATVMISSMLLFPSFMSRLVFVVGLLGIPFASIFGAVKARSVRRAQIMDEPAQQQEDTKVHMLEEERDFYRALVEGKNELNVRPKP